MEQSGVWWCAVGKSSGQGGRVENVDGEMDSAMKSAYAWQHEHPTDRPTDRVISEPIAQPRLENETGRSRTYLQRKIDWEPTNHIPTLRLHRNGIGAKFDARVEFGFKVSGQAVTDAALAAAEGKAGVAGVVGVAGGGGRGV